MAAIEAAARAEIAEKARIAAIARAAAKQADDEDARPTYSRDYQTPASSPSSGQDNSSADDDEMSPEERAKATALAEELSKARVAARAAARENRLKAAASGVPLPATDGRPGEWYFIMNNEAVGPVLAEELREKIADSTIVPPLKMIWTNGMTRWMPVYECPQLWEEDDQAYIKR